MKVKLTDNACIATREPSDPKYYGVANAAGESALLYAIKKALNAQGWDFIKKRMAKDGHLMSDMQQYLRERKPNKDGRQIAIYNGSWQIEGADVAFNNGKVILLVEDVGIRKAV